MRDRLRRRERCGMKIVRIDSAFTKNACLRVRLRYRDDTFRIGHIDREIEAEFVRRPISS
jgi:hypothetical protein